jgi:AcrR family transcriptional regulator
LWYSESVARRDAVRNRQLLVSAGRDVFAERGADASLEEIARRAGVGIGTLYRHFPTREALVEVIFEEHIEMVVAAADRGTKAEDAWAGLVGFLEQVLELQARNLPLRDVFLRHPTGEGRIAEQRRRIGLLLRRLVARARKQGTLRADFTAGDLSFALWSFSPLLEASAASAPNAWRRHLRILLDGFRPEAATPQQVRPLTARQLEEAADALRSRYHRRGHA